MTPADFRSAFPEFASTTDYPDARIQFWIAFAGEVVLADRWDPTLIDMGQQLYVAHQLVLSRRNQLAAQGGGSPGTSNGVINSKSVDRVSVGYDTTAGTEVDGSHFNLTTYGVQFLNLARMVGAGGVQF